jgi:hypothetical protein
VINCINKEILVHPKPIIILRSILDGTAIIQQDEYISREGVVSLINSELDVYIDIMVLGNMYIKIKNTIITAKLE